MQNEPDRFDVRRSLRGTLHTCFAAVPARVRVVVWRNVRRASLAAALLLSAPYTLAASSDAPTATSGRDATAAVDKPATGANSAPGATAAPAAKSATPPAKKANDASSKEPDEFKPSESLSEDATVAYPSNI